MNRYKRLFCFIVTCSFLLLSGETWGQLSQQQEIDSLTSRLKKFVLAGKLNKKELNRSLAGMQSNGSWLDIDYDVITLYYNAQRHLNRLNSMALAYSTPESGYYESKELLDKILLGLDYFYLKQPVSTNWWYIDIGAPMDYMTILLLLKNKIDREKLLHYSSYLKDRTTNMGHQGKNRTWVSSITIWKGCIEDEYGLIEAGFNSIASTIKIVRSNNEEGIKADYSIHQHRPQLYSGGYGLSFMEDLGRFIYLSDGLSFSQLFTPEKRSIITQTMFEGQMLFGYRSSFDFGAIGRNISRVNGACNISRQTLDTMITNEPAYKSKYEKWKEHIEGGPFPAPGNKYFWKSAIMTHHGANYYLSAKVTSIRNNGTEMLNGENLKGYYLPLGATNILTSGQEYKNIFPVWDWTRIPGTTGIANQSTAELRWYHFGSNRFAGGVSNLKNGVIAYEHAYNGVVASKSYFFFGDAMLCLGAGIEAAKTQMVTTSVNQCFQQGDVFIHHSGKTEKLETEKTKLDDLDWAYHDNVGYIFPYQKNVVVQQKTQRGSWSEISDSSSSDTIAHKVFSLWVEHGLAPVDETYCYIVMPDKSLSAFGREATGHGFDIISNTTRVQAVKNVRQQNYGIVFYQPGEINLENDLILSSDKPILVYLEKKTNGYEISVADPLFTEKIVHVTINRKLKGKNVKYEKRNSVIRIELPEGDYMGSSITADYKF